MTDSPFQALTQKLAEREAAGLLRHRRLIDGLQSQPLQVDSQPLLSFCSNDYLGLASHPDLIDALQQSAEACGVGAGASHQISGHHRFHEQLEQALAAFVGLPRALLFSTGYMANLGTLAALAGRGDAVFADRLNHASLNDAVVMSRAEFKRYAHNDMAGLESLLAASTARRKLVVTDAVFSMDGDIAPLHALLAICERYDAWLMLDDAHGFGVLGNNGRGALEYAGLRSPRIIYMATLGKAAGVAGAFVAGEPVLVDYLLQSARTYIFTTAAPPALSGALLAALPLIADPGRRDRLRMLSARLKASLKLQRWRLADSVTPIQPILIGSNHEALAASGYLQMQGVLVPAIRPPTVPKGTARLRISLSAAHDEQAIDRLVGLLHEAERALAP